MTAAFASISSLLAELSARVAAGIPGLPENRVVAVTGWKSLLEALPMLTALPAAVLAASSVQPDSPSATRTVEASLFLGAPFAATAEAAASVYDLLDQALAALSSGVPGQPLRLPSGAAVLVDAADPLDLASDCAWYQVSLKIRQSATITP
jgi:hypothetical protein